MLTGYRCAYGAFRMLYVFIATQVCMYSTVYDAQFECDNSVICRLIITDWVEIVYDVICVLIAENKDNRTCEPY